MVRVLEVRRTIKPVEPRRERPVSAATRRFQRRSRLLRRPHVVRTLARVHFGILRTQEPAPLANHLADHVLAGAARRFRVERVAPAPERIRIQRGQLPVVVEHLLEVRHRPRGIHGVAVETAAHLVEEAADGHRVERPAHHLLHRRTACIHQEPRIWRRRELGRTAEAAVGGIGHAQQRAAHLLRRVRVSKRLGISRRARRRQRHLPPHDVGDALRLLRHAGAVGLPCAVHRAHQVDERRPPERRLRREVRPAEEGLERLRIKEHVERPAAARTPLGELREHLARGHHEFVHVRALLSVHLHRNARLVQHPGRHHALEALALHHVAPVARAVANRDEERHLPATRLGDGLRPPRPPVDRVVRMLQEVGALGAGQAVGGAIRVSGNPGSGGVGRMRVVFHGAKARRADRSKEPP